jgi:hypothetical protein
MLKFSLLIITLMILSGCAGIRFCAEKENPKATNCRPLTPDIITGGVVRD